MRTRFLDTDYFAARSPTETLRGFHPLSLPAPHLPPPDPLPSREIPSSDLDQVIQLRSEIDCLPIEDALSQFLSDFVPQLRLAEVPNQRDLSDEADLERFIYGADEIESSEEAADFFYGESKTEVPERRDSKSGFQFEVVEVELPLREPVSSSEMEESGIHFEVPDIQILLDIVTIEFGLTFTYPHKFAMSIFSVDDVLAKVNEDQDCFLVKDGAASPGGLLNTIKLPHFEVSVISLELDGCLSMEDAFDYLLPKMEHSHGSPNDELVVNGKEFLASTDIDVLENFSGYAPYKDCLEYKPISLTSMLDMDLIHLNDSMLLEKNSVIYPVTPDGDHLQLPCSVQLLEVQIFDFPSVSFSQRLDSLRTAEDLEMSEKMFKGDMDSAWSFYESLVSSELALVDDTFKSLPASTIYDDKILKTRSMVIGDILSSLKSHPLTACDEIYLDWHPLLEGACNREICSTYMTMLEEVSDHKFNSEMLSPGEQIVAIDLDFLDDSPERLNILHCEEVPIKLNGVVSKTCDPSATEICKDEIIKTDNERQMPHMNAEKVSFLFESMSQSNNLNFFLDVRRGTSKRNCEEEIRNKATSRGTPPVILLEEPAATHATKASFEKWDIEVHEVSLSDHILCIIEYIHKTYLAILENDVDLRKISSLQVANKIELFSLPKQKLLELITEKVDRQFSGYNDRNIKALVAVCAIKQLAYFLCFFGVHTAQLYLSNLMRSLDYLTVRLRPLESLIESACWKAEKGLIESHPSLSVIEGIMRSNSGQNGNKVLIVAERIFWLPLNLKLTSLEIKIYEVNLNRTLADQNDLDDNELPNILSEALLHSDCLLASHEHMSASFPFDKFSIILEYGGPYASSRISSISPDFDGLPCLHLLKVKLENNSIPKALCEGFDVSQNPKFTMEGVQPSMSSLQGRLSNQDILGILNFVPIEDKDNHASSESAKQGNASGDNESAASVPYLLRSKNMNSSTPFFPDIVVVVNTQNFEKNMLISRRSSYQKILAMEKGGVQVVERDIHLPLDLIFSAAVCLVWYEVRNIWDTTATVEESAIYTFMESIATNILMSLSFAFSGCILIFEGESNFLAAVMESSDALYAAAASLDMNLQLLCSYLPESTDEIIMSCIRNAARLNTGLFPAMPESETLGESFLTRFPSINPLSAHAILSSGGMLVEYLEWSPELRIQAIGKYHVPEESISLFGTLCRFGDIGESKSVMTECSSIGSEVSSKKLQSQRKKQKYAMSSHSFDMTLDDSFYVEALNGLNDDNKEMPQESQSYQLRKLFNVQDTPKRTRSHEFSINEVLGRNRGGDSTLTDSFKNNGMVGCKYLDEEFSDEVLDHNSTFLGEKFHDIPSTTSFLGIPESQNEPAVRSSLPTSRVALGTNSRACPTSAKINFQTNKWTSTKNQSQTFENQMQGRTAVGSNGDIIVKGHEEYLKENFVQVGTGNVVGISIQEKPSPLYGKNPYSNASKLSRKRGPQCTIEFVQRMKEKSKMHQQTLPCNTCVSCPGSLKNGDIFKRQSPSTIDSFRYQGGSHMNKVVRNRCRKGVSRQMNSNIEKLKDSSFVSPSWTPIDKRARQNLSFTRNGNEKQSKLVWRSRKSPGIDSCMRKRFRDEG